MMVSGGGVTSAPSGTKKRSLTVNHLLVPSTQINFPVLVSVTDVGLKTTGNGGNVTSANGYDIRPYVDSGLTVPLTYELEFYDGAAGTLVMWVLISSLSSVSDTVFYLRYGDSSITTDGSSTSTWDSNFLGVWHLGNGTTLSLSDSTSNARTLTNTASVAATTGKVDGGAGPFNGTTQALNTPAIDLTASTVITMSMWASFASFGTGDKLMSESSTNFNSNNGTILVDPDSSASSQFDVTVHTALGYNGAHFTRPSTGEHYFVFTWDLALSVFNGRVPTAYVDGVSQAMTQDGTSDVHTTFFGNFAFYFMSRSASSLFHAATYADEIRLSKTVRSDDWITTEYNNQSNPGTFETLGAEGPA